MNPITLLIIILGLLILLLVIVLIVRTLNYPIEIMPPEPIQIPELDGESIAKRIGLALQMKTIANRDSNLIDPQPFEAFHELLRTLYPQLEEKLSREVVNRHALLYTWEGRDPNLEGICLMAHQDVVPADETADSGWTYPPFSGTVADGYVWGRGSLDCKGSLIAILEAVNNLVKAGFQPERNIYLAFGDDEEVGGLEGASHIVKLLQKRGVRLSFVLDEGGAVTSGILPGLDLPVAAVGIGEKGYLTLRLRSKVSPGHSSTPPQTTAIGSLSLAIAALEANPFPQNLEILQFLLRFVASELPFIQRMALANTWLFGSAVKNHLAANPATNAFIRTTLAPTIIQGGQAENILPAQAEALINLRIRTDETIQEAFEYVREIVSNETVEVLPAHSDTIMDGHAWDPSALADIESPQYLRLHNLIHSVFPGALVMPNIVSGGTDARKFEVLTRNCFRFSPKVLTKDEMSTIHGIDERLSFVNAARMTAFYQVLIQQLSSLTAAQEAAALAEVEALDDEEYDEPEIPEPVTKRRGTRRKTSKPVREHPPIQQEFYPQDLPQHSSSSKSSPIEMKESPTTSETAASAPSQKTQEAFLEPLPDDDEPLNVRPMKKKD